MKLIIIATILATTTALPAFLVSDVSKSTLTKSDHLINHGSTYIHAPVVPVLHELSSAKSTVTKSQQVVNHGGTTVLHPVAHVVSTPHVLHSAPHVLHSTPHILHSTDHVLHSTPHVLHSTDHVLHSAPHVLQANDEVYHGVPHSSIVFHSPYYNGASAVSHQSSTVHETVPVVNHLPLYALHH